MTPRHPAIVLALLVLLAGCSSQRAAQGSASEDLYANGPQQVALLDLGFDALAQRVALIRAAQQRIDVHTFIYADDATGRFLLDELGAAADRGVRVRVLVDAMFCAIPPERMALVRRTHPGLHLAVYNPRPKDVVETRRALQHEVHAGLNHRMHNKLLVIDGAAGITGGRNHEDTYFDVGQGLNYRDREVLIRGTAVRQMSACAASWWFHPLVVPVDELVAVTQATSAPVPDAADQRVGQLRDAVDRHLAAGAAPRWREVSRAGFCWDVPGRPERADATSTGAGLHHVLSQASSSIEIVSPYCVLNSASLDRLQDLRDRGLTIDILTNSLASTDAWWAYGAYLRDRRRLIANDVAVYETRPLPADLASMWSVAPEVVALRRGGREPFLSLHAKCVLADEKVAVIGTFNLDPRSKHINTEQVMILWDDAVAADLATLMRQDAAPSNAWRVGLRDLGWFHAPFVRLSEWTGDWLSLDIYPVQPTTCYDLKPGCEPGPRAQTPAAAAWNDVGPTPEASKDIQKRASAIQTFGAVLTPLL